jgi:hypothetical protein
LDPITGADFVQVTFEEVTYSGDTRLGISQNGPKPPNGYKVSNPHSTFDLSTTALFNGLIETCVDYNGLHFGNEKKMKMFHRFDQDGDGIGDTWEDVTTSHDTDGNIICGVADSFSTFGVFEQWKIPSKIRIEHWVKPQDREDVLSPQPPMDHTSIRTLKLSDGSETITC